MRQSVFTCQYKRKPSLSIVLACLPKRDYRSGCKLKPSSNKTLSSKFLTGRSGAWFKVALPATVIVLAFALRLTFFLQLASSPIAEFLVEDSKTYHDWAMAIAGGKLIGDDVFHALPLYPYFLGLIYALSGGGIQTARLIQVILGAFNCGLLYLLGKRLFQPAVALLAAFLMATYGLLIIYDSAILSPVLIIFLCCLLLLVLLKVRSSGDRPAGWLGAGALTGISAAVSAHVFAFIPLVLVWAWLGPVRARWTGKLKLTAAYLLGVVLAIAPFTWHNRVAGNDFVLLTAHSGINFYIGNNPKARGVFEPPPGLRSGGATLQQDAARLAQVSVGRRLKPSEINSFWFRRGVDFVRNQPFSFLRLLGTKFIIFWDGLEIADVIHPYFFLEFAPVLKFPFPTFAIVAPFALLGMALAWKQRRKIALLYLFTAAWIFSILLFFINARYRLPLVPFVLLFAAYALIWWWDKIRFKKWAAATGAAAALIGLIVFVNPQLFFRPRFVLSLGAGHNHLGTFYFQRGDWEAARRELERARDLEPRRAEAHYNLANLDLRLGRLAEARQGYELAIKINPFYESAHLALALVYEQQGEISAARRKYLEIVRNSPRLLLPRLRLAYLIIYREAGKPEEAVAILKDALELEPSAGEAYFYLAEAYVRTEDYAAARKVLEQGIKAAPKDGQLLLKAGKLWLEKEEDFEKAFDMLLEASLLLPDRAEPHLYLGDYYYRTGHAAEARASWRKALQIRPDDPLARERLQQLTGQKAD